MNFFRNGFDLVGRIAFFAFFFPSGIEKILGYGGTAGYMAAHGVPGALLPLVIITEVGLSSLLLLGWHSRIVGLLLAGYCFLAVLFFHTPPANGADAIIQMAELAAGGGLLFVAANGARAWSLDSLLARRAEKRTGLTPQPNVQPD